MMMRILIIIHTVFFNKYIRMFQNTFTPLYPHIITHAHPNMYITQQNARLPYEQSIPSSLWP